MSFVDLHGVINLNKPSGVGSTEVLNFLKRNLKVKKIGHGGTLDPFASGVLPIGINRGTRMLESLLVGNKAYRAVATFGACTDTLDRDGHILSRSHVHELTQDQLNHCCQRLLGRRLQDTPQFAARRISGQRMYDLARKGEIPQELRPLKEIEIYSLAARMHPDGNGFDLDVHCSKGTYVRQLVQEILADRQEQAFLSELQRISVASLRVENSIELGELLTLLWKNEPLEGPWLIREGYVAKSLE